MKLLKSNALKGLIAVVFFFALVPTLTYGIIQFEVMFTSLSFNEICDSRCIESIIAISILLSLIISPIFYCAL